MCCLHNVPVVIPFLLVSLLSQPCLQAVAVFLFNLGVSSLAQSFDTLINEPSNFVQKLALNVPGTFSFFSSFMLIRALPENAGQLLHGFGVAVFWAFRKLAPTERTRERLLDDTSYEYSSRVPVHSMAVLICMVYSAVTPVLPVIGLLYMCMAYLQTKYCVTYMTTEQFQAGGLMWLQMHSHIMSALLISQVTRQDCLGPFDLLPETLYRGTSTASKTSCSETVLSQTKSSFPPH